VIRRAVLAFLAAAALAGPALAVNPDERLADPALEARARSISQELRCLVCQNQSIDDSNADLAHDLRVLVRERLAAGDSDDQVIGFLRQRYGEFVLLDPPVERATWVLWFGPPLIVAAALAALAIRSSRRQAPVDPVPLDPAEEARLRSLLDER
jgi:cytochrome c-type biogenesis protein CcmH